MVKKFTLAMWFRLAKEVHHESIRITNAAGIRPLKPIDGTSRIAQSKAGASKVDFGSLLQNKLQQNSALKFSAHALKRLEARELNLNELDLQRLQQGVRQLEAKGAQNSVVLMDDRAFVVSVKTRQ